MPHVLISAQDAFIHSVYRVNFLENFKLTHLPTSVVLLVLVIHLIGTMHAIMRDRVLSVLFIAYNELQLMHASSSTYEYL